VARVAAAAVEAGGVSPAGALLAAGLCASKAEARRLVEGGGVYWNWERVSPREGGWAVAGGARVRAAARGDFVGGEAAVVSAGKKRMALVLVQQEGGGAA
jgi:tyrosyl-tRNA synthetase